MGELSVAKAFAEMTSAWRTPPVRKFKGHKLKMPAPVTATSPVKLEPEWDRSDSWRGGGAYQAPALISSDSSVDNIPQLERDPVIKNEPRDSDSMPIRNPTYTT